MAKKNRNDQVSTPTAYVEEMLDRIGYRNHVVGETVLENSCGQGNILISIVNRYIADAKKQGLSKSDIVKGLEHDITAFEIDRNQMANCIRRLDEICDREGLCRPVWNIKNQDFLKYDVNGIQASYVIGNPPYITYHDIEEEERKFLKEHFTVCKKGRFDYCYAFIEASIKAMDAGGKMVYLIPFSIFRNRYAQDLRKFIRSGTTGILDFSGRNVFPGITCSAAFLLYEKEAGQKKVVYQNIEEKITRIFERNILASDGGKWVFSDTTEKTKRFGDYFCVHNSIATLLNEAFLISPKAEDEAAFLVGDGKVEREICLQAVSTRSAKKKEKRQYIIFPYKRNRKGVSRYTENEFRELYPYAYQHIRQFEKKLSARKVDQHVKWFEYGRGQALDSVWKEKLILPMVITKQAKVYWADADTIPYAGYFVTLKESTGYTLKDAERILQSPVFYQYVKEVGTPTTETSYRISVNDIKDYRFG